MQNFASMTGVQHVTSALSKECGNFGPRKVSEVNLPHTRQAASPKRELSLKCKTRQATYYTGSVLSRFRSDVGVSGNELYQRRTEEKELENDGTRDVASGE